MAANMLARRAPTAALLRSTRSIAPRLQAARAASTLADNPDITDPNMNGGYVNPPPGKRILRDPHADWWDKQERRNFGEPVHEDNDIYAIFSTDVYRHATLGKAWLHFGAFVVATLGLVGTVYQFYPDRPSAPRTFEDGLEAELGGQGAVRARKEGEDSL